MSHFLPIKSIEKIENGDVCEFVSIDNIIQLMSIERIQEMPGMACCKIYFISGETMTIKGPIQELVQKIFPKKKEEVKEEK